MEQELEVSKKEENNWIQNAFFITWFVVFVFMAGMVGHGLAGKENERNRKFREIQRQINVLNKKVGIK